MSYTNSVSGNGDGTPIAWSGRGNLWVHSVDSLDRLMTTVTTSRGGCLTSGLSVSKQQHCSATSLSGAPPTHSTAQPGGDSVLSACLRASFVRRALPDLRRCTLLLPHCVCTFQSNWCCRLSQLTAGGSYTVVSSRLYLKQELGTHQQWFDSICLECRRYTPSHKSMLTAACITVMLSLTG